MSLVTDQIVYLLNEKYPGSWRCDLPNLMWVVDGEEASIVVVSPNGEYIRMGALVGSSGDYWRLCEYAATANSQYEQGRIYVTEGQPGTYNLVVEEHLSEQLVAADNSLVLLWQSLLHLSRSTHQARLAASQLDGFDLMDPTSDGFGLLTMSCI